MGKVNIKQEDIFMVRKFNVVISNNDNTIYFLKDLSHNNMELDDYVHLTKPVVKYLHSEGFIKTSSVKIAVLSNN